MSILSPRELKESFPLTDHARQNIALFREEAKQLLLHPGQRIAIILGPCSIHNEEGALEYADRLRSLQKEIAPQYFLVMRTHLEKPRTITGWKGLVYDPHLDNSHDIPSGLLLSRKIATQIAEMGIPIAMEFVDPLVGYYLQDLVTWGFIGARTCASAPHRQFASSLPFPIGFKNATDGNLTDPIQGILSAESAHAFLSLNEMGRVTHKLSSGNPFCHLTLRGSCQGPNWQAESVAQARERLKLANLPERILIDCAHGNCQGDHRKQITVFHSVLEQIQEGSTDIFGIMLESFLEEGSQGEPLRHYGTSITDPCIDWATTEDLILGLPGNFQRNRRAEPQSDSPIAGDATPERSPHPP